MTSCQGNDLDLQSEMVVKVRTKLYRDVPVTLKDVLEDFYEYLKRHQNETR